ncbi:MAG: hypothetical protein IKI39_00070 [Oscillospiraceae bacterium]|nr:hypothetical protein [Oscillospiraceae bacterium]
MEQNNKPPKQYSGTKGLSLAIVIGVAIGTVIGKLMNNMNTGLMLGLVIGVAGWVLLFNRRQKTDVEAEIKPEENADKPENDKKE